LATIREYNRSTAQQINTQGDATFTQSTWTIGIVAGVGLLLALILGITLSISITNPLNKGVAMMQEMGKGHLSERLHMERKDEIGTLAHAIDKFTDDLQNNVIATMKKIAIGDLSTNLAAKDNQDEITPVLNTTIETLRGLVSEATRLSQAAVDGKLATRGDGSKYQGGYKEIVQGVNNTLDAVIGPLNVAANYVDRISKGDIPAKITDTYNGDFNTIKNNLNQCIDAVNLLVTDAAMLSKAAVDGKLATRADASKHQGDFRKVVQGVDETLDAVIGPLNVAANYVDRISKGDIPAKITDTYNGDFNTIKNNLNQCIDAVNQLVADAGLLSKAAVEGKLATRADATKHQGDYRKVVQGVNDTLDAVIGPLNVSAGYVDRISKGDIPAKITDTYNGDFNTIKNNLNQCIDAVNQLVTDAGLLSKAAVDGKLATRADATKHQGDYRKIVQGVNDTLDAVIGPLNVSAGYVDRISKGDIPAKITDSYNGDFNTIKNNLNQAIDAVNMLVNDAAMLAKAAVDGKLATRADASKHQGDYRKVVQGVNDTLDAVIGPLNVAAGYVDLISRGEIAEKIVDNYNGDFNTIKSNINSMLVYLEEMSDAAGQIAEGDLTAEVSPRSKKDVLGNAFSKMITNLNNTMAQTNAVTNQVVQAVEQVRSVSQDLSSNAQEQSAAVEEVASSVQETDSQVKASSDHASMANQLVSQTATLASAGQVKMNSLSESINSISHSSQEISKIIKVIDDIAFQTNMLALNAAVEAARAGQYGKGFAVVAQEVRNLAERSAKAAKSTAELVEDSSRRVAEGVSMTGETAQSLNEIVQNVVKVKDLVGEIAAASEEQTKALNQISQAITQVSQGTQSNSSQSEELASTADELGGLADRLRDEVDRFKLNNGSDSVKALEMVQSSASTRQKSSSKAASAKANNHTKVEGIRNIDRDERGYGKF